MRQLPKSQSFWSEWRRALAMSVVIHETMSGDDIEVSPILFWRTQVTLLYYHKFSCCFLGGGDFAKFVLSGPSLHCSTQQTNVLYRVETSEL